MSLVLVMVGLPARGKTYTARKLSRYLSWRGLNTRVFNVGNYRRELSGAQVPHSFFDPTNNQGMQARRQAAESALNDLLKWVKTGGEVGIYDATNSTKTRRDWVFNTLNRAGMDVAFVELICDESDIIESNIRETKLGSPDYAGVDTIRATTDFVARISHYESAYETLVDDRLTWIKVIDAGRQVIVNRLEGHLLTKIAAYLMNLHISPRTFWFTRHGQSQFNLEDRVGGDSSLSASGRLYSTSLHRFFEGKELDEVLTSTLQRTIQTAEKFTHSKRHWKALDEINAGICDGLTYAEIKKEYPRIASHRGADKLRYRYPQGESYEDVIERLEPVIFELERSRKHTLVVAHQAVLRALYAYFANRPLEECPYLSIPLHTVIQMTPKTYGCVEMRFALPPQLD